ncbi:MAG TPA: thiol reductant ABC exporter subunit CydD [Gaiellaceae bacterium]
MRALDPRLLGRARAARTLLGVDVAIGIASAVLLLLQATLLARVVTRAFDGASLDAVSTGLLLLLVVFAARAVLAWGFEVAGRRAASDVLSELRLELVEQRLRRQPVASDGAASAEIAAAAVQGVDSLEAYFARYLPQLVLACVVPFAALVWIATVDITSALVLLATLPLVPVFMWLIGRYTEEQTRKRWQSLRLLSTHFLDVVRGLPTLRAFNRAGEQAAKVEEVSDRYREATMATLRVSFVSGSVLELAATLGVALAAVTVGVRLVDGGIGLQAGLTVLVLAPELYQPLRQLGAQFHASVDGLAVAERMLAVLDAPPAVDSAGHANAPSSARAPVRLERVSFAYPDRPGLVLDALDLELFPGETVGLVGESGAGKSTVAALLLRLRQPAGGRVSVGGVDLAECDAEAWRRQIAWLPQQPTLFRGTVADNIRLADAHAADDSVRAAARLAGADAFVRRLPSGYDTIVGDGGRPLSAGEVQRVALARAFLRDAPFVILDEPTANLDPTSAALVVDAVERLGAGRTVLLITHRPEVARQADRIVRLVAGRVAVAAEAA